MDIFKEIDLADLENEIWVDSHIGISGAYSISNLGRIKSLSRIAKRDKGYEVTKEIILKQRKEMNGYLFVGLYYAKKKQTFRKIHRLVAEAFIPNPAHKKCVNHKNGIKTDNRIWNLEWVTHKENTIHAHKNNLINVAKGENHVCAKLTEKDVLNIRAEPKEFSDTKLSVKYKISRRSINLIRNRKNWKHI